MIHTWILDIAVLSLKYRVLRISDRASLTIIKEVIPMPFVESKQ
ncbi:MAG: hypothetical protein V7K36_07040 [Nostoc sp.]